MSAKSMIIGLAFMLFVSVFFFREERAFISVFQFFYLKKAGQKLISKIIRKKAFFF